MPTQFLNISQTFVSLESGSSTVVPYTTELAIAMKVLAPMWPVIITFGLISNIINITVFLKAGVRENVSVLLLSLSISDLTFLTLITPTMCGFFIEAFTEDYLWPFDFKFIQYLFYWPAFTAYDLSAFISVSLGATRCACVAMPLKFKLVFTKSRTVKWVLFLVILAIALRVPVLTIFRITLKKDPATNLSYPYVIAINRPTMSRINDIMNRGCVVWINYIAMVTCVGVLTFKLYQGSKIRRSVIATKSPDTAPERTEAHVLQSKDLHVIKSVVLVCSIFILSQLPFLIVSTFRLINTSFTFQARLQKLFTLMSQTSLTFTYLNASLNIFVYYNYNSKYREVLLYLLHFDRKK